MVRVYDDSVVRRHFAPVCSTAFCVQVILWAFLIVFPFFVAFATNNFWLRESTWNEQPKMIYKQKLIFIAQGSTPGQMFMYTSYDEANQLIPNYFRVAEISSSFNDTNFDNVPDVQHLQIRLPLQAGEEVKHVTVLAFYEVTLQAKVRLMIEGALYLDYASALSGSSLKVDGDLNLKQVNAFPDAIVKNVTSLINGASISSLEDISIPSLLSEYAARNESTVFTPVYTYWTPGNVDEFRLSITARINTQVLRYRPNFLEAVKFAWIQYVCMFWIVWWAVQLLRGFIFREQIVPTRVVWEVKLKED